MARILSIVGPIKQSHSFNSEFLNVEASRIQTCLLDCAVLIWTVQIVGSIWENFWSDRIISDVDLCRPQWKGQR